MGKSNFSPLSVEKYWIEFEDKIVQKLVSNSFSVFYFLLLFVVGAYLTYNSWTGLTLPSWGRFFIAQDRYWATLILLASAFIFYGLELKYKSNRILLGFIVISSWLFPIEKLSALRFEAFYPIFFIFACMFLIKHFKNKKGFLFLTFIALFILMNFGLYEVAQRTQNGKILQYFSVLHLDLLLLYFIHRLFAGENLDQNFDLNPLQLYAPLPIPAESKLASAKNEKRLFFLKGCFQVLQAQVIFIFLFHISSLSLFLKTENPYIHYISFLFFIVSAMKMLTGLLWMYGFKVKPASHFIFFSKSPLEIWRRGSVYMAHFAFFNVYLPVWKRVRNNVVPAVAVVLFVYIHLFFFHDIFLKEILSYLLPGVSVSNLNFESILQPIAWIIIWILWILIFLYGTKGFSKYLAGENLGSWLLVFGTHLGSASIIPLIFFLQDIFFKK